MRGRRVVAVALAAGALALAAPGTAQAHPLGNFTVNHADHLLFSPDRVDLTAVLDRAEIPTAQALQSIAPDGTPTADQLDAAATTECTALTAAVRVQVDGADVRWESDGAQLESIPGAAGLPTLRLTCTAHADAALDGPASVSVSDDYLADRVGWREMTADGDGVRLIDSPVPVESSTDQLRSYPVDLLSSPLDVRSFAVETEPGTNTGGAASVSTASGDPFSNAVAALDRRLEDLIGDRELTPLVGTLAVLLAVLLGCGHALLPGHGKTVMAAYLAGRDGRPRDAVTVGATVTATHTAGVLALGLAISASSSLAGDQVIRWLGVVSGLLVAGIGIAMLRGAVPRWLAGRGAATSPAAVPEPALAAATAHPAAVHGNGGGGVATAPVVDHPHDHDHDHPHPHPHPHPHDHSHGDHGHGHDDHEHHDDHDHAHGHDHEHEHEHEHEHDHGHDHGSWWSGGHSHGPGGHTHGPGSPTLGRGGLVGMGIAGGLVPSPSALIVLLGSIGLGRTVFGVLLVLAYGVGMAGTLTAVGLLLVRLRGRLQQRAEAWGRRGALAWLARALPVLTASLVLLVGLTLAVRGVLLG